RPPERPAFLVPGLLVLFVAGVPWWLSQQHNHLTWPKLVEVARAVDDITPRDELIWADEMIYFAALRIPPSGLEHSDSHKLQFSPSESTSLHVVPRADLYDWIAAGRFATVEGCFATDDWIDESGIRKVYKKRTTVNGCDIFWSKTAQ